MCGIAGIIRFNDHPVEMEEIKIFTDAMFHRGPDGSGYMLLNDNKVGLGHRRLSILDLSESGNQPMCLDNRYWITYNGEIFNFLELKKDLEINYHVKFHTDTDTEVILYSYKIFGKECFKKFNGMWAMAIWDKETKKIILCRDRFGVKPLHYFYENKNLCFASETLAFSSLKKYNREIDESTLLFSLGNPSALEPTGKTIYKNINQLLAGHWLEFDEKGNSTLYRWWHTFDNLPAVSENFEENKAQFFDLLMNACKIRLRSDVPIASALSGGLDSSSIFGMIHYISKNVSNNARIPNDWKKAVVACFPGTEIDEKFYADQVINYLNAKAIYTQPNNANLVNDIIETTKKFDSISGTPIISVTDVYKAMRQNGIKVSMDGHGGDEILYGYKSSVLKLFNYYLAIDDHINAENVARTYSKMGKIENEQSTYQNLIFQIEIKKRQNLFHKVKQKIKSIIPPKRNSFSPFEFWHKKSSYNAIDNISTLNLKNDVQILANDFFIDHIPYNLRDFDRGSMQNGIEIRMPLMDYRLVAFTFALNTNHKVHNNFTKYILRESMVGLIPESIRLRTNKIGLGAPTANWFNNQLNEFIADVVNTNSFITSPFWNGKEIRTFAEINCKNKTWNDTSANKFWNILNAHLIINY